MKIHIDPRVNFELGSTARVFAPSQRHLLYRLQETAVASSRPKNLDQFCDHACPSSLMAGPEAGAVIAVEVLKEKDVVLPLRIGLEFLGAAVHWSTPRLIPQEDAGQTVRISLATSNRFIKLPEPVGHSILKLSP